jgi:chromosome segregation ATPase
MENIQLRNLYIGKIQKQLNKTINSISLLEQLQNVINQSGGGNVDEGIATAKKLIGISTDEKKINIAQGIKYPNNRLKELEGALSELEKVLFNLREELKNNTGSNEKDKKRIEELEKLKIDLEQQIDTLKKEKDSIQNELVKMKDKLDEYNKLLEELKGKIKPVLYTNVMKFNNSVESEINMINNFKEPGNITNADVLNKVVEKYKSIYNENKIKNLISELDNLKIIKNDLEKVNLSDELLTKGIELTNDEASALTKLVEERNKKFSELISGEIYNEIVKYNSMINLSDLIRYQTSNGLLETFNEKNKYFGFKEEFFKVKEPPKNPSTTTP